MRGCPHLLKFQLVSYSCLRRGKSITPIFDQVLLLQMQKFASQAERIHLDTFHGLSQHRCIRWRYLGQASYPGLPTSVIIITIASAFKTTGWYFQTSGTIYSQQSQSTWHGIADSVLWEPSPSQTPPPPSASVDMRRSPTVVWDYHKHHLNTRQEETHKSTINAVPVWD